MIKLLRFFELILTYTHKQNKLTACCTEPGGFWQIHRTDGQWYWAEYMTFSISDEVGKYQLTVNGYSGDAGNVMMVAAETYWIANGKQFTTLDSDNDAAPGNCAVNWNGGWWQGSCSASMINRNSNAFWMHTAGFDVQASRMLVKFN